MTKIFVIGMRKTGTSSVEIALDHLNYKILPFNQKMEILTDKLYKSLNPREIIKEVTRDYDAFQDAPWFLFWREVFNIYPDAKYILTVRSNADKWLKSIINHSLTVGIMNRHKNDDFKINKYTFGYRYPGFHEEEFKKIYKKHNSDIREFFKDKDNFLEMNLSDSNDNWTILCDFLGRLKPMQNIFPHELRGNYKFYEGRRRRAERHPKQFFGYDKSEL